MEDLRGLMGEIKNRRLEEGAKLRAAEKAPKVVSEAYPSKIKAAVDTFRDIVKELESAKVDHALLKRIERDQLDLSNWFHEKFGEPWEQ